MIAASDCQPKPRSAAGNAFSPGTNPQHDSGGYDENGESDVEQPLQDSGHAGCRRLTGLGAPGAFMTTPVSRDRFLTVMRQLADFFLGWPNCQPGSEASPN